MSKLKLSIDCVEMSARRLDGDTRCYLYFRAFRPSDCHTETQRHHVVRGNLEGTAIVGRHREKRHDRVGPGKRHLQIRRHMRPVDRPVFPQRHSQFGLRDGRRGQRYPEAHVPDHVQPGYVGRAHVPGVLRRHGNRRGRAHHESAGVTTRLLHYDRHEGSGPEVSTNYFSGEWRAVGNYINVYNCKLMTFA